MEKHRVSRLSVFHDVPTFSRTCIFFLLIFSLLTLLTSAFQLSILSEVSLLNFLRIHIQRGLQHISIHLPPRPASGGGSWKALHHCTSLICDLSKRVQIQKESECTICVLIRTMIGITTLCCHRTHPNVQWSSESSRYLCWISSLRAAPKSFCHPDLLT